MRALLDTAVAFKLVWVRVACYFIVPFFTTFLALTETFSQATWNEMGHFLRFRLLVSCFVSGITSLVAFIDSSFQKARQTSDELKEKRENTQFFKKAASDPNAPNG